MNTNWEDKVLKGDNNGPKAESKSSHKEVEQVAAPSVGSHFFGSSDLRNKSEGYKATKVKEMGLTLNKLQNATSGRAIARKRALQYSVNILCK